MDRRVTEVVISGTLAADALRPASAATRAEAARPALAA